MISKISKQRKQPTKKKNPTKTGIETKTFNPLQFNSDHSNRVAAKSLARPGRKQATATEDSDVNISYL